MPSSDATHTPDRCHLLPRPSRVWQGTEEVPEQLVRAVNQINVQDASSPYRKAQIRFAWVPR